MLYKAKVAVCFDIRTKHSTQGERHVQFLIIKPGGYVKKPLGSKRLMSLNVCASVILTVIRSTRDTFNWRILMRILKVVRFIIKVTAIM